MRPLVLWGLLGALVAASMPPLTAAASAADLYLLSPCSVARDRDCEECDPIPIVGALALEPGPLAIRRPHHLVSRLILRGKSLTFDGTGLLIRYHQRLALIVTGELNGARVDGSGSGWVEGDGHRVFHARSLTLGPLVLDLDAAPAVTLALDGDRDGLLDSVDRCPGTACGALTDSAGCAPEQLCPCAGPLEGGEWASPGSYVRCLGRATRELRRLGHLSAKERREILIRAAASGCGRSALARAGEPFELALLSSGAAGRVCR